MSLDIELIQVIDGVEETLYDTNITHNLGKMAKEAGIYEALWSPEEVDCEKAEDIIDVLEEGVNRLKNRPDFYKTFNASNGWGLYEHFVPFVENYLEACKENPSSTILISR